VSGRFITFEGGEGVGKTTQLRRTADWLRTTGVDLVVTREPGGTPQAEALRQILLTRAAEPMPPAAELLLEYADTARCDVIAAGAARHGRVERWILGSVSTDLVRDGRHSVLVIPPP